MNESPNLFNAKTIATFILAYFIGDEVVHELPDIAVRCDVMVDPVFADDGYT